MRKKLLGPDGKATVILIIAQFESQLPKIGEIKRFLKISDGKYYSSFGNFENAISEIDKALAIVRTGGVDPDQERHAKNSNFVFVTVADVHSDLFMALKYSGQLLAGFNLTNDALEELNPLLQRWRNICWMRDQCKYWPGVLRENINEATSMGLSDPSILEVDIDVVARITKPYAMGAFAQVHAELSDWYERYRWRTVQEASEKLKEKVRSDLSLEIVDEQMA
jgi:hypothetical protein